MSQLLEALHKPKTTGRGDTHWQWGLPSAPVRTPPAVRLTMLLLLFFAGAGVTALGWQLWHQFAADARWFQERAGLSPAAASLADAEAPVLATPQPPRVEHPGIAGMHKLAPKQWSLKPLPEIAVTVREKPVDMPAQRGEQAEVQPAVSPELAEAFKQALATVPDDSADAAVPVAAWQNPPALPLAELPEALRGEVPPMSFSSHVYSSSPANRLVRVNGRELHEGDWLTTLVQLVEIRQDQVIMRVEGQSFSLPALAEWN